VYWAGYPGYLNQSGTDLTSFTLAGSGQVGFSVFNTIFAGDEVTTWGHDLGDNLGRNTTKIY